MDIYNTIENTAYFNEVFLPLDINMDKDSIIFNAGGASVVLKGLPYKVDADMPPECIFKIHKREFIILSLEISFGNDAVIRQVTWLPGQWTDIDEKIVSSTAMQDNFLFIRKNDVTFFFSLDFPCSSINDEGIFYRPCHKTGKANSYVCHTLTAGACRRSGIMAGDYDRAEIEAASLYIEKRFSVRFEKPMLLTQCIFNRMAHSNRDGIFYSMYDNPTISTDPELLMEDIALNAEVGIEYVQFCENRINWIDVDANDALTKRISAFAKGLGLHIGDYASICEYNGIFYNYDKRELDRPEWMLKDENGERFHYCLGSMEYKEYLMSVLMDTCKRYGMEFIDMDFLDIRPCYETAHGHPAGDIYRQVQSLVDILKSLNATSPEYLAWSNSGNWIDFMPKLVWYNPNVYLTDPQARNYIPALNMLKLLGDTRREQMVTLHNKYFIPYRFFCNYEYYLSRRSRIHDLRVFEYSLLQGLAVTPNLGLGELRTFLDRIPGKKGEKCKAFIKKWINFIKDNYQVWKHTIQAGAAPGTGNAEIYAHMFDDRGFICLINENAFSRTASFKLDRSIGLVSGERFRLFEIYPKECLIIEQPVPFAVYGDEITCHVPSYGVRYIEIRTADHCPVYDNCRQEDSGGKVSVYGVPASVVNGEKGYRMELSAPQGEKVLIGLVLPECEAINALNPWYNSPGPIYSFPVTAELKYKKGNIAYVEVVFPAEKAPVELNKWRILPDNMEIILPAKGNLPFLGARVSGAFSEDYKIYLDISIEKNSAGMEPEPVKPPVGMMTEDISYSFIGDNYILETEFELPFIEWDCFAPGYEDDTVIELIFSEPEKVKNLKASINGHPVEVLKYKYPYNPGWFNYYIELTCNAVPGKIALTLEFEC